MSSGTHIVLISVSTMSTSLSRVSSFNTFASDARCLANSVNMSLNSGVDDRYKAL
jgi:hypothetical protein